MQPSPTARLVCPNHPGQQPVHLAETDDGERVHCPRCHQEWPNYFRYPIQETVDLNTGEIYHRNVFTGERVN